MAEEFVKRAQEWLDGNYDQQTKSEVKALMEGDRKVLEDAFYKNLEFGTGGLRGVMGVGTNRMNRYVVGMATQGFANYIKSNFKGQDISVAISYDSRLNSQLFAGITAEVFAANGFTVYLFDDLRPTPELSFAVRHFRCKAGVMVTASHNPKEYNGYKAYWEDGAQITSPHDRNIIAEVQKITDPSMVKFEGGDGKIVMIGEDVDRIYLDSILSLLLSPEEVKKHSDFKIVYSALHGTGVKLVPQALKRAGFENVILQKEQCTPDGNFPTLVSPNPEERSALELSLNLADEKKADIVMATDPDADRLGIAIRDDKGELVLLNGNQTASILTYYLLERWSELRKLDGKQYMVKTIVTSELLAEIAASYGVKMYNVLTGFKYIAEVVRENEGKTVFIGGGEESYGFNAGEFVRDKDAVISCCLFAECAAWAAEKGLTVYGLLQEIYRKYGYYQESLISLVRKGKEGVAEIAAIMEGFRTEAPKELAGSPVIKVIDYNHPELTGLPKSNVLQFFSRDGSVVSVRPSGTEPKIKFYFGTKGDDAAEKMAKLREQFGR